VRPIIATLLLLSIGLVAPAADDEVGKPAARVTPARKSAIAPAVPFSPEREAEAMEFVREHHPELATVLEALKPMDPAEFRKAVGELSGVARTLAEVRSRNPRRYEIALDTWKAKSRVELIAAQLAGAPDEERASRLRLAIEARLDVEVRRHKLDLELAEAAAKRARDAIGRIEGHRDSIVEARLRALSPKKAPAARRPDAADKPDAVPAAPAAPAASPDPKPTNGGNRR